jgi:hypothetical protein
MKEEIDRLWEEVLEMRKKNGECRDSPQKEKAIQLIHKLARQSEEGRRYFYRKRAEIRWRLAKIDCRERKYDSALLQIAKGLHLCEEINDKNLMAKLLILKRKINEARTEVNEVLAVR